MATNALKRAFWIGLALSVPAAIVGSRGCGSSAGEQHGATESDAMSVMQPETSSGSPYDGSTRPPDAPADDPCAPRPIPSTVPKGWEEYPVMDCKYRLYVPSSRDHLPKPPVWEPCTSNTGSFSDGCRQLKMDWPMEQPEPVGIVGHARAAVGDNNDVVLQFSQIHELAGADQRKAFMGIVADADGPVRQAIWADYVPFFTTQMAVLFHRSVSYGKSSWSLHEMVGNNGFSTRSVAIAGDDTLLRPPVLLDNTDLEKEQGSIVTGPSFYMIDGFKFIIRRWGSSEDVAYPALGGGGGGPYAHETWVGDTLLFSLASFPSYAILRWTEQDGTRTLVGFPGDETKGASNEASDGKDFVWVQGEGRGPEDKHFPTRWIMTSKYSTDPEQIHPRRLIRWKEKPITSSRPPKVGCGYAAFSHRPEDPQEQGLLIVRLSDGVSWHLPNVVKAYPDGRPFSVGWFVPMAVTCDEVFALYRDSSISNIRRVRLDSLGPGTPPPN